MEWQSDAMSKIQPYGVSNRTKKWRPLKACNLLGMVGGNSINYVQIPYQLWDAPSGQQYHCVLLNHRQSWLTTLVGGSLKRCATLFDNMREKYKLQQMTEAAIRQREKENASAHADADVNMLVSTDPVLELFAHHGRSFRW